MFSGSTHSALKNGLIASNMTGASMRSRKLPVSRSGCLSTWRIRSSASGSKKASLILTLSLSCLADAAMSCVELLMVAR
jgi:hypothetical protein